MEIPRKILIKEFLVDTPEQAPTGVFLFGHGAGKGMATPFMNSIAKGIMTSGVQVIRFHYPYMEEMLKTGRKRPPNGGRILRQCLTELIIHFIEKERCSSEKIIIGGKSLSSRVASMVADEMNVAGTICLGYPFHPPKKPERLRDKHLKTIKSPVLICQGERDPYGKRSEINPENLSNEIRFRWLPDGDHSFKPRKLSGVTLEENMLSAIAAINHFITDVLGKPV